MSPAPMSRPRFVLAALVATTAVTVALLALDTAVHRWGASNVAAGACWVGLGTIALWGLADTATDRRHGRGEWAEADRWHELDNTLRGDR